jgi:hypothetical protein
MCIIAKDRANPQRKSECFVFVINKTILMGLSFFGCVLGHVSLVYSVNKLLWMCHCFLGTGGLLGCLFVGYVSLE